MLRGVFGRFWLPLVLLLCLAACSSEKKQVRLKLGDKAPDFAATDLSGQPLSLAAYQGKAVILRFWSTECRFCRADTPIFNRYFEKYKDAGLRVVYVNRQGKEEEVRSFVEDLLVAFPVVLDRDGSISKAFGIKIEPQTIVIDAEHRIVAAILGGISEEEFKNLLGKHLPQAAGAAQPGSDAK